MMQQAERRALPYLFTRKQTPKGKRPIGRLWNQPGWQAAGGGWPGLTSELQLSGWSRKRRVVRRRRLVRDSWAATESDTGTGQALFAGMAELQQGQQLYEYAVLVTCLPEEVWSIAP
jgi:hypothetical protein